MLETLRRQSGSFVIWFIFAILIAAFVLFFGPQASGRLGCGASDAFVVEVDGHPSDLQAWRFAMNSQRGGVPMDQRRTRALDALVGRTLLANAARAAGFTVSEDQVIENLKQGIVYILGVRVPKEVLFEEGTFSYDKLDYLARQRGLPSIDDLIAQQKEEILANLMRVVLIQVEVSRDEAEHVYVQQNTTVKASYVKYDYAAYRDALVMTDADVQRYLDSHLDEVKELYQARKAIYEQVGPQVRVRAIEIAKPEPKPGETADARAAESRAKKVHTKLESGEDFAAAARQFSDDARTKNRGGDLGWRPVDSIGLGKEVTEAAKNLEQGKISPVIETPKAFYIVRIDGKRQGKLDFDAVKLELAEDNARTFYAREAAQRDARAALAKLQTSGATLESTFPAATEGKVGPASETPPDQAPASTGGGGAKTGALWRETRTIPASWGPEHARVLLAQAAPAAAGAAPAAAAPAAPVKLPEYEAPHPTLETVGPTPRRGDVVPQLGRSPELARALFETLEPGQLAEGTFDVGSAVVIARLDDRTKADLKDFDGEQVPLGGDFEQCSFPLQLVAATGTTDSLPAQCLLLEKSIENLQRFLFDQCSAAAKNGRIRVNTKFISDEDSTFKYSPCGTLGFDTAFIQVLSLSRGL